MFDDIFIMLLFLLLHWAVGEKKSLHNFNNSIQASNTGLILGLRPANEKRCYFVTTALIGWGQAYNQPWNIWYKGVA